VSWEGLEAPADPPADALDAALPQIAACVRARTRVDLGVYRRPMLDRRIRTRMMSVGTPSVASYLQHLRDDAAEAELLLQRITIKVSRFYRNAAAFGALRTALARLPSGTRVTLWSAGCGRGEEAWTLAMLVADANLTGSILATDLDGAALAAARRGRYPGGALAELPDDLRRRYLRPVDDGAAYEVAPELRDLVRFRVDDLTVDAPAVGVGYDVVCCRNVSIYFVPDVQRRVLRRLAAALREGGLLLLGESEWPLDAPGRGLRPVRPRERLFAATSSAVADVSSGAPFGRRLGEGDSA
jgi:chemotaxis methyl-accepting protein methylase